MLTYDEAMMWYELSDWYQWAWEQGVFERLEILLLTMPVETKPVTLKIVKQQTAEFKFIED